MRRLYVLLAFFLAHAVSSSIVAAETVTLTAQRDAWIYQGEPSANTGDFSTLVIGNGVDERTVSLLWFDISSIPPTATINSAKLRLYCDIDNFHGANQRADVNAIDGAWSEFGVTWNSAADILLYWYLKSEPISTGWVEADVSSIVVDWHSGEEPNQGIAVYTDLDDGSWARFRSRESTSNRPQLVIVYNSDFANLRCVDNVQASDDRYNDHISITWSPIDGEEIKYRVFQCDSSDSACSWNDNCDQVSPWIYETSWDDYPASSADDPFPGVQTYYRVQALDVTRSLYSKYSPSDPGRVAKDCTYTVSPTVVNVGSEDSLFDFIVETSQSACTWYLEQSGAWIDGCDTGTCWYATENEPGYGSARLGDLKFHVVANSTGSPRTAYIDFYGEGGFHHRITVNQAGPPLGTLHPADAEQPWVNDCGSCTPAQCGNGRVETCELLKYMAAWKRGDHDDSSSVLRSIYLWKSGECYTWSESEQLFVPDPCD